MLKPVLYANITPINYKKPAGFGRNTKSPAVPVQNLQSPSSEYIRANFHPAANINKISFGISIPRENITPKDVITKFNEQLSIITPEKIQKIIDSFDEPLRPLAAKIMQRMTQFGNMESLNKIAKYVKKKGGCFYKHDLTDLSTVMRYLNDNKKAFNEVCGHVEGNSRFFILDQIGLEEIETNKIKLELVKNAPDVKIVYPEGWINGINPFNQAVNIKGKVQTVLDKILKLQSERGLKPDKALELVLNEDITERITKLGLRKKFTILRIKDLINVPHTAEQISKQLAPAAMSEKELTKAINDLPEESRQLMLEYLLHNTDIYSPRRLSISLQKMHKHFERKGMTGEDVYYFVPNSLKSYGIISMMYKTANNIPLSKILLDTVPPANTKRLILLDDFAGSGKSLYDQINHLKNFLKYKGNITLAPVISTDFAMTHSLDAWNNITFCPYKIKKKLKEGDYFKMLSPEDKEKLIIAMKRLGFNENGFSIVFPYTSPDNNNLFFATNIAPRFTLNGSGAAMWL